MPEQAVIPQPDLGEAFDDELLDDEPLDDELLGEPLYDEALGDESDEPLVYDNVLAVSPRWPGARYLLSAPPRALPGPGDPVRPSGTSRSSEPPRWEGRDTPFARTPTEVLNDHVLFGTLYKRVAGGRQFIAELGLDKEYRISSLASTHRLYGLECTLALPGAGEITFTVPAAWDQSARLPQNEPGSLEKLLAHHTLRQQIESDVRAQYGPLLEAKAQTIQELQTMVMELRSQLSTIEARHAAARAEEQAKHFGDLTALRDQLNAARIERLKGEQSLQRRLDKAGIDDNPDATTRLFDLAEQAVPGLIPLVLQHFAGTGSGVDNADVSVGPNLPAIPPADALAGDAPTGDLVASYVGGDGAAEPSLMPQAAPPAAGQSWHDVLLQYAQAALKAQGHTAADFVSRALQQYQTFRAQGITPNQGEWFELVRRVTLFAVAENADWQHVAGVLQPILSQVSPNLLSLLSVANAGTLARRVLGTHGDQPSIALLTQVITALQQQVPS